MQSLLQHPDPPPERLDLSSLRRDFPLQTRIVRLDLAEVSPDTLKGVSGSCIGGVG